MNTSKKVYRGIATLIIVIGFLVIPLSFNNDNRVFGYIYILVTIFCVAYLYFDDPFEGKKK